MKKILLMALVVMTIFSCSKEEENVANSEPKSIKLSIKAGSLTRAAEQPLANDAKTTIHSLYVYFLDAASGNIVSGSKAITGTELAAIQSPEGLEIAGVNSSAKYVYVVANATENGITLPASGTLATIKAKTASMGTNDTGDWSKALLSNSDAANNGLISAVVNNKAGASVIIMPDLARIEVSSLVAKTTGVALPDHVIFSYNLKAVYLNNYYTAFHIGGVAEGAQAPLDLTSDDLSTNVPVWAKDEYTSALTGKTTYTAADGLGTPNNEVWAYMLPAGNTPRVIFKLENVLFGATGEVVPAIRTRFVTVKAFRFTDNNSVPAFERGKVYKVNAVNFSANDTHENPNATDIDVTVNVEVLAWEGIEVNPEL